MCRMLRAARMLCLFLLCSALAACTAMPGRSAWDSAAAPVSYTHLDVYKRQDIRFPKAPLFTGQRRFSFSAGR